LTDGRPSSFPLLNGLLMLQSEASFAFPGGLCTRAEKGGNPDEVGVAATGEHLAEV
jgi:hypothetical protein